MEVAFPLTAKTGKAKESCKKYNETDCNSGADLKIKSK